MGAPNLSGKGPPWENALEYVSILLISLSFFKVLSEG
jgi:hypothetical protein